MSKHKTPKKDKSIFELIATSEIIESETKELKKENETDDSISKAADQNSKSQKKDTEKKRELVTLRMDKSRWKLLRIAYPASARYSYDVLNELADEWLKKHRPDIYKIRDTFQ